MVFYAARHGPSAPAWRAGRQPSAPRGGPGRWSEWRAPACARRLPPAQASQRLGALRSWILYAPAGPPAPRRASQDRLRLRGAVADAGRPPIPITRGTLASWPHLMSLLGGGKMALMTTIDEVRALVQRHRRE